MFNLSSFFTFDPIKRRSVHHGVHNLKNCQTVSIDIGLKVLIRNISKNTRLRIPKLSTKRNFMGWISIQKMLNGWYKLPDFMNEWNEIKITVEKIPEHLKLLL